MRILFDQGTPLPLRNFLPSHQIQTTYRLGWQKLKNGDLITAAERDFDLVITTDKNWRYQQRVTNRRIAILVLPTTNWPELRDRIEAIVAEINGAKPGDYVEL